MCVLNVKVISLPYIFQVFYVLCFTRPRYQVSIGPLVFYMSVEFCDSSLSYWFVLVGLRLYVPVNSFSAMSGRTYWFVSCVFETWSETSTNEPHHEKTCFSHICKNKGTDQLRGNRANDQCLCFSFI